MLRHASGNMAAVADRSDGAAPSPRAASGLTWHVQPIERVLRALATTNSGLTASEAALRRDRFGPNELRAVGPVSAWHTLGAQFKNVLIVILLAATVVSAVLGHTLEAIVIAIIVTFAVLLGFIQEFRAERALEALKKMAAPVAHVIRDGVERALPAREIVPGDVLVLRAGDRVPADSRITLAANLSIDESALTGESAAIGKSDGTLGDDDLPLGDRRNMAYAGTLVTYGRGQSVAVATGMDTEFGQISALVQSVESGRTPLQENLDRLGATLGKAALVVVALIVVLGIWRGLPLLDMVVFGIALAVAVVPEALPAVVTIALAIGVRRMVKRNALVRRLPIVETLGSTSVICSDKTGTLTRNEMTVRRAFVGGRMLALSGAGYEPVGEFRDESRLIVPDPNLLELLRAGVLASDARLRLDEGRWLVEGDTTEGALVVAAAKASLDQAALEEQFPRIDEIPFSSERRRMTTLHEWTGIPVAYSKGAAEVIFDSCTTWMSASGEAPLTPVARERLEEIERRIAGDGLRVLAIARKFARTIADAEDGMTLLGLVGIMDPPRPEARVAVQTCQDAGIRPVMITGDHPATATSVARELGLLTTGRVVSGKELARLTDEQLDQRVHDISVYARVSPPDKLRVISAWQKRRDVVAMTGDGVNDAPALKKADVGIAMGITGTDVSKEAASITLLDDNFASIVAAVEEGRIVFANIKKFLMYLLSSNLGEMLLMAGAALAGLPLPLTAVQVLYVNLASDGLPALALAVDPPEDDLMHRKPRDPRDGIFTRPVVVLMLAGGIWSGMANLALFSWALASGRPVEQAMAMTFASLVLIQFFKAYNYRSDRLSVFHRPFANHWLNLAVAWELALLAALIYVPWLHGPFTTFSFTTADCLLVAAPAMSVIPVIELAKVMERRGWFGEIT
jgi:P-type Ca2+ transporter type 2C